MGLWGWNWGRKAAGQIRANRPKEIIFRFLPNGQISWYEDTGDAYLKEGFLGNHVVFSIVDWIGQKVASAPPMIYRIKDDKAHKRYKALMKDATPESVRQAIPIKRKALEEMPDQPIMDLFTRPNSLMPWHEFAYGHVVYKNIVGSSYWAASRGGIDDPTSGPIREMWLLPAQDVQIKSGGVFDPILSYSLKTNPTEEILSENVLQIRNFSPDYETPTQWLYGMSKLRSMKPKLQEYNEGTEANVDMFQKRGIRDIVFPKGQEWSEEATDEAMKVQDMMNKRIQQSGPGGIIANSVELGSIRVGLGPQELGILESQKITKKDFCALFHVPDIIFGWSEQTTYNNLSESRKIALTDAVLPELEAMKDGINNWLIPSWYKDKNVVLDFDYEYFPELQEDTEKTVKWMTAAGCLTTNEKRAALRYDAAPDENADKVLVPANVKLLESIGTDSFETEEGDDTFQNRNAEEEDENE